METQKTPLALFDFDGTMIHGDSIVPFLSMARKRGDMPFGEWAASCLWGLLFLLKRVDGNQSKSRALRFYHVLPEERKKALDQAFAEEYLLPRVYAGARAALQEHKKAGCRAILVSASTINYMQYVAPALGFDELLCTPVEADGRVRRNCHGQEKVCRIREYLAREGLQPDFARSHAYGDSRGDLPMLQLCGHPVQVNAKKALKKAAPEMERVIWK